MAKKERYKSHFLNDVFIEGRLRFPKLNEPDDYGNKPAYKTGIIIEPVALAALKKKLVAFGQPFWPEADLWLPIKKDKKDPSIIFVEASTKKVDEETGVLIRPVIVDAKKKHMSPSKEIAGGTIAKIKCTAMDYEGTNLTNGRPGVALLLETVQIKKLSTYRDPLAGFGEEDGYSEDGEEDIEHSSDGDDTSSSETSGSAYDL